MKTLGGIALAEQKGLASMPQKAVSAWSGGVEGIVGASYKPLVYVGKQVVKGTNYHFIAEQTLITATTIKHIVKIVINEFNNNYEIVKGSIEVIY